MTDPRPSWPAAACDEPPRSGALRCAGAARTRPLRRAARRADAPARRTARLREHGAQLLRALGATREPRPSWIARAARVQPRRSARTASPTTSTPTRGRRPAVGARPAAADRLPADEWAAIEAGVAQRARPARPRARRPLRPADAAARGRCCRRRWCSATRLPAAAARHACRRAALHLHIVRRRPGARARRPLVGAGDRTQAPSGAGYALENRLDRLARCSPRRFASCRCSASRRLLRRAARTRCCAVRRAGDGAPRIVLLTPGPYNETYFEHAYLARYLGLPLVEGSDLTVRDDRCS